MLTENEYKALKGGQHMVVEVEKRSGSSAQLVQIVPIRGRHTGKIVRYSVTMVKRGRGTVAR